MKKKQTQDADREEILIKRFNLTASNQNRIGIDAVDEFGNCYELKSTTTANKNISTARDVGRNHLEKWRKLNWIFACGTYDENSSFVIDETYLLFPSDMEPWFQNIESKIVRFDELLSLTVSILQRNQFNELALQELTNIFKRGASLNNPTIVWSYIKSVGKKLDSEDPAQTLRNIMEKKSCPLLIQNN